MRTKKLLVLLAGLILLAAVRPASAQVGTQAGTDVSNSASVAYTVGGVNQPNATSNTVTFKVDRRINLTVAEVGGAYTDVASGTTAQALKFTVHNTTNDTVDFRLSYAQATTGAADPFGGNDSFDTSNVKFYLDDGDGTFNSGTDTLITFLDNIAPDATATVFVVSDIGTQADGAISSGTLTAIANSDGSGGAANDYTETAGPDTAGSVDTVLGDGAGDTDIARDGKHSDSDAYRVITATISVVKTATVISDPFNGTTDPKAIPGAVIEFCIQVSNTGGAAATSVITTDTIPANTTYVAGSIVAGGTVTAGVCNADGASEDDDNSGADESDPNGGNYNGTDTVTTTISSVAAGATTTSRFRVTIN